MTRAGTVLLPNGWSLKPAGRQTKLGDLPVQIAVHPSEPILAILHAGYGEHEVVTVNGSTGQVIGRVVAPGEFRRLGLVGRRQAALRRRRVRRPDLPLRPRRRLALEQDGLRVSRPQGVPGGAESARRTRRPRSTSECRRAWRCPRTARPCTSPRPSAIRWAGSTPSPGRFRARSRSRPTAIPMAWRSTSRASSSTSASGARPRWPSSTPTRSRSSASGRPRSTPTRCCWRRGARSCSSPTPTATRSRVIDTEAGKADRDDRHGDRPQGPAGQHAQFAGALARRVDALRRQRQHQ